ncbi:GPI-anchored serine-rich Elicitin INL3b [Phytophthora megakarya]|uniref:Elicitin n=1 Tax=Phytophthora megakarya TaxID=4795 RepID=A0A225W0Z1_9STRA|nr:GPI-anchored serine-rich Elicitin INL3b [Phytophthora megakarya]
MDLSRFLVFLLSTLVFVHSASAEDCTMEQLSLLASNTHVAACSKALGFSEILSLAALSKAQVKMFCANSACMQLYNDVLKMDMGDCTIPAAGAQVQRDIVDPVTKACGSSGSTSSASSSTGSTAAEVGSGSSSSTSSGSTISISIAFVYFIGATVSVLLQWIH